MAVPVTLFYGSPTMPEYAKSPLRASYAASSGTAARPVYRNIRALGALLAAIASAVPVPARAMNTCTNPIAACPCAIRSAGDYTVSGPGLLAAPPGDCIHVTVPWGHAGPWQRDYLILSLGRR
jgi:hypothetical protein